MYLKYSLEYVHFTKYIKMQLQIKHNLIKRKLSATCYFVLQIRGPRQFY